MCASSFPRADYRFTINDVPSYRPIGSVAAHLFARRWLLYVLTCVAVFGLEFLFYTFVHVKFATLYAMLIGSPLVSVVVLVNVGADATGTLPAAAQRFERIIERAWAIIVLDVLISIVAQIGLGSMLAPDAGDKIAGIAVFFLAGTLVYAEPFAALETEVQTITLLPFSLLRSTILSWINLPRIFSLLAIQIAVWLGQIELDRVATPRGAHAVDLIDLAYVALTSAPLAALFAIAYLDTSAQERRLHQTRR
jgi:hypothetical protein